MSICIIAEAGVAHGGSYQAAIELCDAAKKVGADAVKFQTFLPELLVHNTDADYALLQRLALPFESFLKVAQHCDRIGIEFMSTPGDLRSLDFLVRDCRVRRIKIGSDDFMNWPLLNAAMGSGLPLLVSTGMADMGEIWNVVGHLAGYPATLMQCTSLYPCPEELANLRAIRAMRTFGHPVGFSDHTVGTLAAVAAAAAGAEIIEKHIMLPRVESVDAEVSLVPQDFAEIVRAIRRVEVLMGDGQKRHTAVERDVVHRLRKRDDGPFRPRGAASEAAGDHHGAREQQASAG